MTDFLNDTLGFLAEKRNNIKPEYARNGKPVYSLRNYADLTDLDAEVLLNGGQMNLAERVPTIGKRGQLLRTPRTAYAVNVEIAFDNRVKVDKLDGKNVYLFVVDQRALMEQGTGKLYTDFVVAFIIGQGSKKGEIKVLGTKQISEKEFLQDEEWRTIFDYTAMENIMNAIHEYNLTNGINKVIDSLDF